MTAHHRRSPTHRISLAWRELRRGANGQILRAHLLGPDGPPLEQAQIDALEILAAEPDGLRMSEFADAMHVDPSTATRAVDRLQKHGLATRDTTGPDRRVVLAHATPEGVAMIKRINKLRAIGMRQLVAPFEPDELEQFADYLDRFVQSIDDLVALLTAQNSPRS